VASFLCLDVEWRTYVVPLTVREAAAAVAAVPAAVVAAAADVAASCAVGGVGAGLDEARVGIEG